jgi:two-component system LytT family sensor kinase
MNGEKISFRGESIWIWNIRNGLIGIAIGIAINLILSALNGHFSSMREMLLNILFSLFIALSITNSVFVYETYLRSGKNTLWTFIAGYYLCNLIGMVIGTELSYLIVSAIFKTPYSLVNHLQDYRFSLVIVLVVGTSLLLFRYQRVSLQNKINKTELDLVKLNQLKTQAELQTLQSKINPHFLYNSLNAIASLIHEDADKAETMTLNLSRLFRYSLNSDQQNLCTIRQEIAILETYLAIEKVRFGERIEFKIDVAESLYEEKIPRFLIQPLVENAFKHGLKNVADGGVLEVAIRKNNSQLEIVVSDNGSDFPEALDMGYGLQSTYEKLDLLYPDHYQIQIFNQPKKQIRISLPVRDML